MSGSRPSLFDDGEEVDLSRFTPKTGSDNKSVPPDTVRKVSDEGGFPSRAARSAADRRTTSDRPSTNRLPLVYRTGRNVVFSAKTTPETADIFYRIAREQGWKAAETFENAIQALVEKLGRQKG
jgi:hypothetical protein